MNAPCKLRARNRFVATLFGFALFLCGTAWAQTASTPAAINPVALVMRWLHILSAVIAIGGAFYLRFMVIPAASQVLDAGAYANLRQTLSARWRMVVHAAVALLLISGLYNYLTLTRLQHEGQPLYHMLFGIKFLLALVVFFLAEALVSSRNWSRSLRAQASLWLALLLGAALLVILIAGAMKLMPLAL